MRCFPISIWWIWEYVDAEVQASSQDRYHVDIVGPVMPDVSWQTKAATGFDHTQFTLDWQAHQVTCPAACTSRSWGTIPDRHGKTVVRVRFPASLFARLVLPTINAPRVPPVC